MRRGPDATWHLASCWESQHLAGAPQETLCALTLDHTIEQHRLDTDRYGPPFDDATPALAIYAHAARGNGTDRDLCVQFTDGSRSWVALSAAARSRCPAFAQ